MSQNEEARRVVYETELNDTRLKHDLLFKLDSEEEGLLCAFKTLLAVVKDNERKAV
jgi:hypothetical protein